MPWYALAILAMFSFSGMTLLIKKLRDLGFSSKKINLFLFAFVFFGFLIFNIGSLETTAGSPNFLPFLAVMGIGSLAAVFGNLFNMTAVGIAPNPGYSQAIASSSILLITIASIFLFDLRFDLIKFSGVILIMLGIAFLVAKSEKKGTAQKPAGTPWHYYSLAVLALFSIVILAVKQATLLGFSSKEINIFLFGFSLAGFLFLNLKDLRSFLNSEKLLPFLKIVFWASFFSFLGNLFMIDSIKTAPNPGYSQAIKSANILIITFLSSRFFASDFTLARVAAVASIAAGIVILVV